MRLMTWNILNGGGPVGSEELERVGQVVDTISPDVLCIQEASGFTQNGYEALFWFEKKLGMRGFVAQAKSGQHVCIFVPKAAIVESAETAPGSFCHSYKKLVLRTGSGSSLAIISAHLNPNSPELRLAEAQHIATTAARSGEVVIAGDLNTISHRDIHDTDLSGLAPRHKARYTVPDGTSFDTRVSMTFEQAGLIDISRHYEDKFSPTAPTQSDVAGAEFSSMRVDYIFSSPLVAERLVDIRVLKTPEVDKSSDHYPVIAEFSIDLAADAV